MNTPNALRVKFNRGFYFVIAASLAAPLSSLAATDGGTDHELSLSAGQAAPSGTTALFENPAGLTFNQKSHLIGAVESAGDSANPSFEAGFFAGNGNVGAALDFHSVDQDAGNFSQVSFGLAAALSSINSAIGISVSRVLHRSGSPQFTGSDEDWTANAGFLYNLKGPWRAGFTAFDLVGGLSAFGGGISYDVGKDATLAVDTGVNKDGHAFCFKPGLLVRLTSFQLSYSYGHDFDSSESSAWMRTGSTVGLAILPTPNFSVDAYYNELAKYYVAANLKF